MKRRLRRAWDWLRGYRYDPESEHCPEAQRYIWRCEREGREPSAGVVQTMDDFRDVIERVRAFTDGPVSTPDLREEGRARE